MAAVAQADLKRVERAARNLAKAQAEIKQAILIARDSGETLADIGRAAGLTPQRIHQLTRTP